MSTPPYSLSPAAMLMLGSRDVQKSIPFYRDLPGPKMTQQFAGFAFFNAGNITIVLSEERARSVEQAAGATEIVFSVEDIRASYEALKQQGVHFEREPGQITGPMWAAHKLDPDRYLLSIFGPQRPA